MDIGMLGTMVRKEREESLRSQRSKSFPSKDLSGEEICFALNRSELNRVSYMVNTAQWGVIPGMQPGKAKHKQSFLDPKSSPRQKSHQLGMRDIFIVSFYSFSVTMLWKYKRANHFIFKHNKSHPSHCWQTHRAHDQTQDLSHTNTLLTQ